MGEALHERTGAIAGSDDGQVDRVCGRREHRPSPSGADRDPFLDNRGGIAFDHPAAEIGKGLRFARGAGVVRSEEHTSELQSLMRISYAVFCLQKKNNKYTRHKRNKSAVS